jgi:hypothetical protein
LYLNHFLRYSPHPTNAPTACKEQKSFCAKVYDAITGTSIKCVILDQIIAARNATLFQRSLNAGLAFSLDGELLKLLDSILMQFTNNSVLASVPPESHL